MRLKITQPEPGVAKDVRIWLDDKEITNRCDGVSFSMSVGTRVRATVSLVVDEVDLEACDVDALVAKGAVS